jgi:hypothetical protein
LLLPAISCQAQSGYLIEPSLKLKNSFTITQYSTKHGLPQNQVISMTARPDGELIISTANGIVEFNGAEFSEIPKDERYKKYVYTDIYWNDTHRMLIGSGQFRRPYVLYPYYKQIGNYVSYFTQSDSIYCINMEGGVFAARFPELSFKQFASTGIRDVICSYMTEDAIFLGTPKALYRYDKKDKTSKAIVSGFFKTIKTKPGTQELYALSTKGLWKIGDSLQQVFSLNDPRDGYYCLDFAFTDWAIFISSTSGLYEVTDEYVEYHGKNSQLPSVFFHSLHYNKNENCLFVGTTDKGLLKLQFKDCYFFSSAQGFGPTPSIGSVIQTKKGEVLVNETTKTILKVGIDTVYDYTGGTTPYGAFGVLAEISDTVYAGTWGAGIWRYKNGRKIDSIISPALPDNSIHAIFQDSKGIIWAGSSHGIAKGKTAKSMKPCLIKETRAEVITFYELKNGNICVGTNEGAYIIDGDRVIEHIGVSMGLTGREVRCFYEDEEGKLWIGTYGGGLYCFRKGKLTSINKMKNARLDKDVFCLAPDECGCFYMTSNHGLWRIRQKDLDDFYYGKLGYLVPFYYGEESGILNTEFNGGFQNNYLKTRNGHFYFPTVEGLVAHIPDHPEFRKLRPLIDEVIINDTLNSGGQKVLERETYSLQFNFPCVTFSSKYNVYYQYRLEGSQNSDWSGLQKSIAINFKMLPPGNYTFYVRAIDAFNDRNPEVASWSFEILPYFYETTWFKTLFVLLISLLVFFITFFRIREVRRKQVEKEKVQRRIAELELNVLLAQMNPHFIFNSLNSLKYFLNVEDIARADEFIDNFSFLLRKVMIYSNEKFISIADEIAMLNAYIGLENIRMNNKFSYTIEADEGIEEKLIPTFIIQPFVENAIKHGFANSEESCNLSISFRYANNIICCIIDDDGVGREKAKELKAEYLLHESKGIANVLERIAIKKESYGKKISIEIVDKKDYTGKARGTMVVINIEEIDDTNDYN